MSHVFHKRVRFGEVDQAQIVYYPRIFHFCHLAMEDFFEVALGVPYVVIVKERRLGFPAVNLQSDFLAPMPFGADLAIEMSFERIGKSSVVTNYHFRDQAGSDCARVRVTTACVDMDAFKSVPIPDDLRAAFERHLVV